MSCYWHHIDWQGHLDRMKEPPFRRWFKNVLAGEGIDRRTSAKDFNEDYNKRARESELKVKGWLKRDGWQVTDVAHKKWGYDLIAKKKGQERKIDVVRRQYWGDGFPTWPQHIYPPRLVYREIHPYSNRPATHYYICNDPMTRLLIVERAVILQLGRREEIPTTQSTKGEIMYHFSDHLGIYEDL